MSVSFPSRVPKRAGPVRLQAVTFDVGGTLIDPWPSVGHAYAEVAARHGQAQLGPELLNRRFLAAWRERPAAFDYSRAAWAEIVARTLAGLSPLAGDGAYFTELYEHFATAKPWRVYDDARPTLAALRRQGLRLAVISNWDQRLRPLLHNLGLAPAFDLIVISAEHGIHKPAPGIFARAVAALGVPASAALHVGDSAEEDLLGARQAGLQALRLDRAAAAPDDHTITSLGELVALTGRPRLRPPA
jgi:putative hydrolase of the HAD superfamily